MSYIPLLASQARNTSIAVQIDININSPKCNSKLVVELLTEIKRDITTASFDGDFSISRDVNNLKFSYEDISVTINTLRSLGYSVTRQPDARNINTKLTISWISA